MNESRFANSRLSDDVEDLAAGANSVEAALQLLQLPIASDVARKAALDFGVKPARELPDAVQPIRLLRIGFAFDLVRAEKARLDQSLDQPVRGLTHDGRAGRRQGLQAGGEVYRIAENRHAGIVAALHLADDRRSRVEADPHLRPRTMSCFKLVAGCLHLFEDCQGCLACPQRYVFERHWRTEHRHNPVAGKALDGAALLADRVLHQLCEALHK